MTEALRRGQAAFKQEAWLDAYTELAAADEQAPLEPDDLDRLAVAAHLIGRDAESTEARTRAHAGFLERGDTTRAARSAFWLAFAILNRRNQQAQAGGWLARARRLLDENGHECAERGLLLCAAAFQKVTEGDIAAGHAAFRQAAGIGVRFGDADVTALARHGEGRALIGMDRKAEGLALLDEVMVAVTRGEVSSMITGVVYCSVIGACHDLFDWRRAQEWTAALDRWCTSHPDMVPFGGACLVRRSELMQLHGAWQDAVAEAARACERLGGPSAEVEASAAYYQLAELHRLQGAFDDADEMYRLASQAGRTPYPGLALLRLAQGQTDGAVAGIARALVEARGWRVRSRLLPACAEIMLAAGDASGARTAAGELEQIAASVDAPFLRAVSLQTSGAVALAAGEVTAALGSLRDAWTTWQDLDVPYELARVRALIGLAYQRLDDPEGARLEFEAAQEIFDRLGAAPAAARLAALVSHAAPPSGAGGLTGRELEVLRLIATGATNRGIAAELVISEKTVARHISNIFTKLDLSSRSAATAYAYEHKLV